MTERKIEQTAVLGDRLVSMDRQELCRLVIRLCDVLMEQGGTTLYHGGVYPNNIAMRAGEDPVIGSGRMSAWEGQELQFVPPELYWNGTASPRGDVYALGLLLYYGVSGGKLPLEGLSPNPQLSRMKGTEFSAPESAGVRLGEIIEKAASFHAEDRFADAGELKVNLESCLTNKYISERAPQELFRKEEEKLSDAERMMLDIIAGVPAESEPERAPEADTPEEPAPELSAEETEELILGVLAPEKEEKDLQAEREALVEEIFGEPKPTEQPDSEPERPQEPEQKTMTEHDGEALPEAVQEPDPSLPPEEPEEDDEAEDVRVYEPAREKKEQREHVPIPILTEDQNPELPPVVPKRRPPRYLNNAEKDEQIAKRVKKRRTQPIGVVLILCGLLIFAALIANHMLQSYEFDDEGQGRSFAMPDVRDDAIATNEGFISAEELERQEESVSHQSYYQIFIGDLSWTDAKNACIELGGQLAVINTQDEFTMVTQLAQQNGVQGIWVGCHRENDYLQWETQEPVDRSMNWADKEPSYTDSRDGAAEDYIMLWNTGNGWAYIDCRNDPVRADPSIYRGVIGYVCEFENNG